MNEYGYKILGHHELEVGGKEEVLPVDRLIYTTRSALPPYLLILYSQYIILQ